MTILDDNKFVSNELLPEINKIVENFLESEYSYIENTDDLEDLEDAEITESLLNDITIGIHNLIKSCGDEYDFSKYDLNYDKEELYAMVESAFNDYKDIMIERYNEEFDKQEYLDEYYSETEF